MILGSPSSRIRSATQKASCDVIAWDLRALNAGKPLTADQLGQLWPEGSTRVLLAAGSPIAGSSKP